MISSELRWCAMLSMLRCLMQSKLAKQVLPVWDSILGVAARNAAPSATSVTERRHPVGEMARATSRSGTMRRGRVPFEMQDCHEGTKRGKQRAVSAKLVPEKLCVDAKKKRRRLPCHTAMDHGNVAHWGVGPSPAWGKEQVGPREYYARESMTPGPQIRGSAMFWKTSNAPRGRGLDGQFCPHVPGKLTAPSLTACDASRGRGA